MTDGRQRAADWLELAMAICDETDALALGGFRRDLHIRTKPDQTLVTQVDEAIERHIRERILAAFPDHGLIGEEYGEEVGAGATRWYVDPIDGTHNFVRGVPVFATLLAAQHEGRLEAAVISAPALGQRWYATRGGGAWAQANGVGVASSAGEAGAIGAGAVGAGAVGAGAVGAGAASDRLPRRLSTSGIGRIEAASLAYSSPGSVEGRAPGFRGLLARAWRDRGFGDFWGYALLAEGAVEAMIEVGLHSWDLAAPCLLVEEAGGRLTDFSGRRTFHGPTALASNGPLHEELLRALDGRA